MNNPTPQLDKENSWKMFNTISGRYDSLNSILSFGQDIKWRKELTGFLLKKPGQKVLDLATGTGEILITLVENSPNIHLAVGVDLADKMLEIAQKKIDEKKFNSRTLLERVDINNLPYLSDSFDMTTIGFGIRNSPSPEKVLSEMFRVLKKGGRALVLEFSFPENDLLRFCNLQYLRFIVPLIGFFFSGHYSAYRYLDKTIETFPYGKSFCHLLEKQGFSNIETKPLMWGVATIYKADKL